MAIQIDSKFYSSRRQRPCCMFCGHEIQNFCFSPPTRQLMRNVSLPLPSIFTVYILGLKTRRFASSRLEAFSGSEASRFCAHNIGSRPITSKNTLLLKYVPKGILSHIRIARFRIFKYPDEKARAPDNKNELREWCINQQMTQAYSEKNPCAPITSRT